MHELEHFEDPIGTKCEGVMYIWIHVRHLLCHLGRIDSI